MINTEIFEYESCNNYTCFEKVLKMVNDFIEKKRIEKSAIIEYHTENWSTNGHTWHYKATISWWQ